MNVSGRKSQEVIEDDNDCVSDILPQQDNKPLSPHVLKDQLWLRPGQELLGGAKSCGPGGCHEVN